MPTLTSNTPQTVTSNSSAWDTLPRAYAIPLQAPTLAEAHEYCGRLARTHYENFSVATWFLPKRLTAASLELLNQWEGELDACYAGQPRHPVFVALAETVRQFEIPKQPFSDLLKAFRQDQTIARYQTFEGLLGYCRYSANPVGHLVLYVCGYRDAERQQLSDFTCTALQLANFWQDVSVDYAKGRIYLPLEDLRRYRVSEDEIAGTQGTPAFCQLMRFEVERTREWFAKGLPLATKVDRDLAIDIELFTRGGQEILSAIERRKYAVLGHRPVISKARKLGLVARAAFRKFS